MGATCETIVEHTTQSTTSLSVETPVSIVTSDTVISISDPDVPAIVVEIKTETAILETGIQGPPGPQGIAGGLVVEINANCLSSDSVGDCVYVTGEHVLNYA